MKNLTSVNDPLDIVTKEVLDAAVASKLNANLLAHTSVKLILNNETEKDYDVAFWVTNSGE